MRAAGSRSIRMSRVRGCAARCTAGSGADAVDAPLHQENVTHPVSAATWKPQRHLHQALHMKLLRAESHVDERGLVHPCSGGATAWVFFASLTLT